MKQIHEENLLNIAEKGLTAEGKAELLTKADLISNFFILEQMKRIPKLKVGINFGFYRIFLAYNGRTRV